MDSHQAVELFLGGLGKAGVGADPGVVDQKVEVVPCEHILEHRGDLADEVIERAALAHIQLQHGGAATEGFDLCLHRLGFARSAVVSADDVDALCRQMQRSAFAQAAAGAGDQCDFTGHGECL